MTKEKYRLLSLSIGSIAVIVFAILIHLPPLNNLYEILELKSMDITMKASKTPKMNEKIAVIVVDDASISMIGQYPWPRDKYAGLLESLHTLGAKVAVFDIEFKPLPEEEEQQSQRRRFKMEERLVQENIFSRSLRRFGSVYLPYSFKIKDKDSDKVDSTIKLTEEQFNKLKSIFLANPFRKISRETLRDILNSPIDLGMQTDILNRFFYQLVKEVLTKSPNISEKELFKEINIEDIDKLTPTERDPIKVAYEHLTSIKLINEKSCKISWSGDKEKLITAENFQNVISPNLIKASTGTGFANFEFDKDGIARRIPLFIAYDDRVYTHIVLSVFLQLYAKSWELTPDAKYLNVILKDGNYSLSIPLDRKTNLIINWDKTASLDNISKASLRSGNFYYPVHAFMELHDKTLLVDELIKRGLDNNEIDKFEESIGKKPGTLRYYFEKWKKMIGKEKMNEEEIVKFAPEEFNALRQNILDAYLEILDVRLEEIKRRQNELTKLLEDSSSDEATKEIIERNIRLAEEAETNIYNSKIVVNREKDLRRELENVVKDKICFIGVSASIGSDFKQTPFWNDYPGVLLQAHALNTLMSRSFIYPQKKLLNLLLILLLGFLVVVISSYITPGFIIVALLVATVVYIVAIIFIIPAISAYYKFQLPLFGPVSCSILGFTVVAAYRTAFERKKRGEIKRIFEHYMAPSALEVILNDPSKVVLGGERKFATAFFLDIRNFTAFSETLEPEEVVSVLNQYLDAVTAAIMNNNGFLDKYLGDGLVACFGVPLADDNHVLNAARAALESVDRVNALANTCREMGKPSLSVRVGLASGPLVAGNIGSQTRFDYTIIGDTVNLASRLEEANKAFGTSIIIGETTYNLAKEYILARELDLIRVTGREKTVRIYELLGLKEEEELPEWIQYFHEGLKFYRNRDWLKAVEYFNQVRALKPDDVPSKVMIERCLSFSISPPPANWDGSYYIPK